MAAHPKLRSVLLVALAACVGCDDSPVAPFAAGGEAAELQAAGLPTLGSLAHRALSRGGEDVAGAEDLAYARMVWLDAASVDDIAAATALRERAYRLASPALAERLDPADLDAAHEALERWATAAAGALLPADPLGLGEELGEARALLAQTRSFEAGEPIEAVERLLRAADRLALTTPPAVAARLVERAEARLAESRLAMASAARGDARLARAVRLTRGSREALDAGDFALAIRRAYYAGQLLAPE